MNFFNKYAGKKIFAALLGVFLIGVGVAFNSCAGLGNDPIGIVYDGIRSAAGLSAEQLGMASNMVNVFLVVFLLFIGRKYISLGTVIYFVPYGTFMSVGERIYSSVVQTESVMTQVGFSVLGCLLLYLGVAIYIAVDMGVDPFTGIVLVICDTLGKEYRIVKVIFDITMIVLGTLLGGKLGAVTVVTALAAGPVIQCFKGMILKKALFGAEQATV